LPANSLRLRGEPGEPFSWGRRFCSAAWLLAVDRSGPGVVTGARAATPTKRFTRFTIMTQPTGMSSLKGGEPCRGGVHHATPKVHHSGPLPVLAAATMAALEMGRWDRIPAACGAEVAD